MRRTKTIVIAVLTLIYAGCLAYWVGLEGVLGTMQTVSASSLVLAVIFVLAAHLLALWRSGSVLTALGHGTDWRSLVLAFSVGGIANQVLNVFGQSLSRAVVLARSGVPFSTSVIGTYAERILAALVIFIFSLVALLILFDRITFAFEAGGGAIVATAIGLAITTAVAAVALFRHQLVHAIARASRWTIRLWPAVILTILIHAMGMATYLALLSSMSQVALSWSLVAAITIIMLITSLPISFAGFGLRELGAVGALSLVGVEQNVAFSVSLMVGLLYLAATGLIGAFAVVLVARGRNRDNAAPASAVPAPAQSRIDNHVIKALALACAVLMFFRIQSQIANSAVLVNVNVADIVVAVALSIIVLAIAARRLPTLFPLSMSFAIAGLTIAVGSGLLVSYSHHDLGNWAYYTRGVGWLIMIGYASLGAAYARLSDERGRLLMLKGLIVVVVTISLLQLGLFTYSQFHRLPAYVVGPHLGGYANNPNAFSFDLATTLLLLIAARLLGLFERRRFLYWAAIIIVATAIYFTASRTGAIFVALVAAFDFTLSGLTVIRANRSLQRMVAATATVLIIVIGPFAISQLCSQTTTAPSVAPPSASFETYSPSATLMDRITGLQESDLERWESDVAALGYWLKNPVLGAGIGAYYESLRRQPAPPQGIHSTFLWFLGEMGTVGFVALLFAMAVIGARAIRMMREPQQRPWGVLLLGCLMLIAVGGLAQDFFYQRIFWFVLGLAMAAGMNRPHEPIADRVYLGSTVLFGLLLVAITV